MKLKVVCAVGIHVGVVPVDVLGGGRDLV